MFDKSDKAERNRNNFDYLFSMPEEESKQEIKESLEDMSEEDSNDEIDEALEKMYQEALANQRSQQNQRTRGGAGGARKQTIRS